MSKASDSENDARKTRVFLSYSRKDRAFAQKLCDRLIADGFNAFLDTQDIVKGEPWRERLQNLIVSADAVIFLISPDSVVSDICDWEVNEAERLSKRVLPVVCRSTPTDLIPGRLTRLNFALITSDEDWREEYPKLCEALGQDVHWQREHTRLSELATRWDRNGRQDGDLIRLDAVREARKWEMQRRTDAEVSTLVSAFLETSEEKEAQDRKRLLTTTGRAFVKPAERMAAEGKHDAALRIAAAGTILSDDRGMQLVPQRQPCLIEAAAAQRLRAILGPSLDAKGAWISPNGRALMAITHDYTVKVWDTETFSEIIELRGHTDFIQHATFSSDSLHVATASWDGSARVWSLQTGRELVVLRGHEDVVESIAFSASGTSLVTTSRDRTARVWQLPSGRQVMSFEGHLKGVIGASFLANDTQVLSWSEDGTAQIWSSTSGKRSSSIGPNKEFGLLGAVLSPDGARLLTAVAFDQYATLWNVKTGEALFELRGHEQALQSISFDTSGKKIVTASEDGTARIWSATSGEIHAVLKGHTGAVRSAKSSPDGALIATTSDDGTARIWDAHSGRELMTLCGHEGAVRSASFYADCRRLVTIAEDLALRVWDLALSEEIVTLHGHEREVLSASFSPDGTRCVTASGDHTARVWDTNSGAELAQLRGHDGRVLGAVFNHDGGTVATTSEDATVRLWNAVSGEVIAVVRGDWELAIDAAFNPDGTALLVCAIPGGQRTWDVETGTEIPNRPVVDSTVDVTARADGLRIASEHRTARILNADGQELAVIKNVDQAVLSPDGLLVATATGREVCFWETASGFLLSRLQRHSDSVSSLQFDLDGARLLTASWDGTARISDTQRLAALAGRRDELLVASLTNGRGIKTRAEADDLLMQSAPDDLYTALREQLTPEQRDASDRRAATLSKKLHLNCYRLPSSRAIPHSERASTGANEPNTVAARAREATGVRWQWQWQAALAVALLLATAVAFVVFGDSIDGFG